MPNKPNEAGRKSPKRKSSSLLLRFSIAMVALAAIGFLLGQNESVAHAFYLATTKQPERFTELYFNNSQNLPTQVTAGLTYSFSYHVTNHEAQTESYTAIVTMLQNGRPAQLETTKFSLPDGQGQDVTVHFKAARTGETLELIVSLPANQESIDFRSKS
jgi:hypothetical protein